MTIDERIAAESRERAAKGAKLLDGRVQGWQDRILVVDLDLRLCSKCVIGQVYDVPALNSYDAFQAACDTLVGVDKPIADWGFDATYQYSERVDYAGELEEVQEVEIENERRRKYEFAALRQAWIAEIEKRRTA